MKKAIRIVSVTILASVLFITSNISITSNGSISNALSNAALNTIKINANELMNSAKVEKNETELVSQSIEAQGPKYSEADLDLLAHLIYAETGYDWISDKTLYYTGSVVLNRVHSKEYPNTIYNVIYQKGQYACTWDGNLKKKPTERCYEIAKDLLENGSILPTDYIGQADRRIANKYGKDFIISDGVYYFKLK